MYQNQSPNQTFKCAKAIEVDQRAIQARYRLLQLMLCYYPPVLRLDLQLIFGR